MRRIAANYIFPVSRSPIKNGIVEVDSSGKVLDIIEPQGSFQESRNVEFYNGVIAPGFVNTHCHLELSEHKNKFLKGERLPNFLQTIFNLKQSETSQVTYKSIELYDTLMSKNGIVAVGDICNTLYTLETKQKSKIAYYNLIEAIGVNDSQNIFDRNYELKKSFVSKGLLASIVPHAPYSVSSELFSLIKMEAEKGKGVISIHNQETESENEMFKSKSGELIEKLSSLGVDYSKWKATGYNSLQSIKDDLPKNNNILFIHNTYSSEDDLKTITSDFKNAFLCLCPKSNLYIENTLPNISLFKKYPNRVTLGTDSLTSNDTLSILEEMKVLTKEFPNIDFNILLQWATINGAKALKFENTLGAIEKGKAPGLNLITNFDFENMSLKEESQVKVLV